MWDITLDLSEVSLGEFMSEVSFEKNWKYLLEIINLSVKIEGLYYKSISGILILLELKENGYRLGYIEPQ